MQRFAAHGVGEGQTDDRRDFGELPSGLPSALRLRLEERLRVEDSRAGQKRNVQNEANPAQIYRGRVSGPRAKRSHRSFTPGSKRTRDDPDPDVEAILQNEATADCHAEQCEASGYGAGNGYGTDKEPRSFAAAQDDCLEWSANRVLGPSPRSGSTELAEVSPPRTREREKMQNEAKLLFSASPRLGGEPGLPLRVPSSPSCLRVA
jgi:hypothetical protein